ncbi:MAG: acyl-CoA dehydrogenase family protein [Deltaproteobacteria bacterium]|nr:acyl-CoA dehydrogenase family protein [Deltaproteobacteria bacterium]
MDLARTPEQQALADAVERFCQEQLTPERLSAWQREPRGIDDASWRAIGELGWFGLALPEAHGGSGLGFTELAVLLHECARGLVPRSVINAIRAAWALARLEPAAAELARLASGAGVLGLALDEPGARDPRHFTTVVEGAAAPHLRGEKSFVPNGLSADWHLVAAREGDGVSLVLVDGAATTRSPLRSFDGEEQARVRYDHTPVRRRLGGAGRAGEALARLRREATALALAEMVGGAQAALDMTVAYVKQREQFGQKLAVFQAVQHQVADMATAFTAAKHLAWQAITRMASGTEQPGDLERAAAFVPPAFKRITFAAHHLHGGAGYVVEHPLHWHSERAQALAIRYAPEAPALDAIADELLASDER